MENVGRELEGYKKRKGIEFEKQKLAIKKYFTNIDAGLGEKLQTNMKVIDDIISLLIEAKNKNSLLDFNCGTQVPISPGVTSDLHEPSSSVDQQQVPEDVKVMHRDLLTNFAYGTMSADCSPAKLVTFIETVSKTPGASTIFTQVQDHPELHLPVSALFTPFLSKEGGGEVPEENLVSALRGLELCCQLDSGSKDRASDANLIQILFSLLSHKTMSIRIACLNTLIALLDYSNKNLAVFIAIKGLNKIMNYMQDESEDGEMRLQCGAFVLRLIQVVNGDIDIVPAQTYENINRILKEPVSFVWSKEGDEIHPFLSHGEMEDSVEKRNRLFQRRITNLFRLMEGSFNQLKKDLPAGVEERRNRNKRVMETAISSVKEEHQKMSLSVSHLGVDDSTSTPVQAPSHEIPTLTVEEVEATDREVDKLTRYFSLADGSVASSNLLSLVGYLESCQKNIESINMFARVQRIPDVQVAPFLIRNWLCKENGVVPDEELDVALRGLEVCYFLHPESTELALESKIVHAWSFFMVT